MTLEMPVEVREIDQRRELPPRILRGAAVGERLLIKVEGTFEFAKGLVGNTEIVEDVALDGAVSSRARERQRALVVVDGPLDVAGTPVGDRRVVQAARLAASLPVGPRLTRQVSAPIV